MRILAFTLLAASVLMPNRAWAEEFEGLCAWALADRGVERKTGCSVIWKDPATGRIYCFSNEQTKLLFLQDPEDGISRAEDAFARLQEKKR
jgi:hypothetical protein